jgi:putative endonuclease
LLALWRRAKQAGPPKLQRRRAAALHYVYLIESLSCPGQRYVGVTADLPQRMHEHNCGKSAHTSKFKPWRLAVYIAFHSRSKAAAFERYLKSGSGHAFAAKHLW